jgi:hypothetical protein
VIDALDLVPVSRVLRLLCQVLWFGAVSVAIAGGIGIDSENFALEFEHRPTVRRGDMRAVAPDTGQAMRFSLADPAIAVSVAQVSAAGFRRTILTIRNSGTTDLPLRRIVAVDQVAPDGACRSGNCAGSPLVAGLNFFGIEHPFAENEVVGGRIRCALPIMQPLHPGEQVVASLVVGTAPEISQMRRAFASYLEHERPRAYAPFLHHNTWYNLGYSNSFTERDELRLMETCGRELVGKRGVKLDGFVLDDGWDDTHTLWHFNSGWPDGLARMRLTATRWGAVPGLWVSPWGGYDRPKQERLAAAAPEGFELRAGGFSLAGPKYYERFRSICLQAVLQGGVGYFKFDGLAVGETGAIAPEAGRDFDAMLRLIAELRRLRPGLYVSQTVGTWPSPWWLLHVDNIWRGGEDHDFAGVGSDRQRWLTYRDAQLFANVVRRAPLFPLNSVMLHGIILARHADRLAKAERGDFADEVRSFFGSGTQAQELYLSPELLTKENWDDLAESARWSRENSETLQDTHWIGGDPARGEIYGWAAWSPRKAIITLRNPSDQPGRFVLEAGKALELPSGAYDRFVVTPAFPDEPAPIAELRAGQGAELNLRPFQVLVLELSP